MKLVDVSTRLQLLPEQFLIDDLTGTVERVFDFVAVVVVVVVDELTTVAIVMTMMCMDVRLVAADANSIAV